MFVRSFSLWSLFLLQVLLPSGVEANVACSADQECEEKLGRGSQCRDDSCTSPFHHNGCLGTYIEDYPRVRVCGSEDPPEAEEMGYCQPSSFDYMEMRLLSQNWETSYFATWLFQIVLNEMLGVPVSIEDTNVDVALDFYNREAEYGFGTSNFEYSEVTTGSEVGDCTKLDNEEYTPCAHAVMEAWRTDHVDPDAERPLDMGALGAHHWYVPKFAARNNTDLLYYEALAGEANRRKLAELLLRPTSWKDYCDEVSANQCQSDNGTAARIPLNAEEEDSFFVEGLYTGYFRATEDNDCDTYPDTCTGHVADFPCEWLTHMTQQIHHLGIALKSNGPYPNNGYTYAQLGQIWHAANATRTPVMMMYWYPEALYEKFIGTEAEFTHVLLPPPTQECIDNRAHVVNNCGDNYEPRVGEPEGACDHQSQSIKKVIARTFRSLTQQGEEALWSPAYEAFENFHITSLQYGEMLESWFTMDPARAGFNPRDAVCRWAVDHLELLESFVPETFPRAIQEEDASKEFLYSLSLAVAGIALVLVLSVGIITYVKRSSKTIYFAQAPVLALILLGLALVAIAALVLPLPPTGFTCISNVWLTDIGYALQIIPLLTRINAINNLATSGNQMQRVRLRLQTVAMALLLTLSIVGAFLVVWTVFDVPGKLVQYDLTARKTGEGASIVIKSDYCGSESDVWMFLSIAWQALLLLPAIVIAFVANLVKEDLNDASTIGLTLSSHLVFVLLRACVLALGGDNMSDTMRYMSLLLSVDTIVALALYFLPKLLNSGEDIESEILPDLFLNTTIMSSDIQGFTAWSSVREPVQVFKFLEALYEEFDAVAEKHSIFKVETTGEHYVAASGLPDYRSDHAIVMARFASTIMKKMDALLMKFEVQFGPDTCDLSLRIGLHSGPVTGGFMKGKQSRFQLFGDTMTTAGLIHDTGESNRIHLSAQTASLVRDGGKKKWVQEREHKIHTAEKGDLQTFWLIRHRQHRGSHDPTDISGTFSSVGSSSNGKDDDDSFDLDSEERWVEWNTEVLRALIVKIVARRQNQLANPLKGKAIQVELRSGGNLPLDEVKEIIELPQFDKEAAKRQQQNKSRVTLADEVTNQLREYIAQVAGMYKANPFHNFAHASYVVMAVTKYMNRIIAASEIDVGFDEGHIRSSTHEAIHDHTYGITSDPLTQFACVFSALIHDIDHPGVPNNQLIKENTRVAQVYKNRSIAEQKSFDMAWDVFVDSRFDVLRSTICSTEKELQRFRSLVINSVMATDLGDQELKALRNGRWSKAFDVSLQSERDQDPQNAINRKATIVIEHLIQASDVAHTCQHWNIYRKWNQRLFEECYVAYKNGRSDKNPAEYWFTGEIGFFDFYIIPLSKKLRDCGVFGATSDENLNYAENNKAMWLKEGKQIVAEMLERLERAIPDAPKMGDDTLVIAP